MSNTCDTYDTCHVKRSHEQGYGSQPRLSAMEKYTYGFEKSKYIKKIV